MKESEFRKALAGSVPENVINELVKQINRYEQKEKCFSYVEMAFDNMETFDPSFGMTEQQFLISSLCSAADCLDAFFH